MLRNLAFRTDTTFAGAAAPAGRVAFGAAPVPAGQKSELLYLLVGGSVRMALVRAATLAIASVVVFGWILLPVRTYGISMLPTYRGGQLVFVNAWSYRGGRRPQRGDVVAIEVAGRHLMYVKRIIGLPGERVAVAAGVVLIDGRPLDESYVQFREPWNVPETTLGASEYFVVGDNRGMPQQEHEFGKVAASRVVGKLLF